MGSHRRTLAAAAATALASLSLYPVFYGFAWFWGGVGAALVVALAGTLTRLRRLPVVVCLIGGLAGLLLYLNLAFENASSGYHLVPTPTSLRLLWDLAGQGFHESARYAPPVPELPGMMLLVAAGIGLIALFTDLIAVRLQSAALAGLPLLLLFTEPFTLSISRTGLGIAVAFCLGTAGYLALLSSEGRDRIREWERPNPGPDELPDTRALATAGRRVGIASMAVALCLPLVIPGLHATRLFSSGQPGIGGTGGGTGAAVGFPDPNTQLSQELHESQPATVFDYKSTDSTPQYFQVYVLDNLTASGWQMFSQPKSLVTVSPRLPPPPGLTQSQWATPTTTTVTLSRAVGQDDLSALPVPYPATAVTAPGKLKADRSTLMVFDTGVKLGDLRYSVTSLHQTPPPDVLSRAPAAPSSITSHYTQVPSSYQPLRAIAESVVTAAKAKTRFDEAVALQDWLSGPAFRYTLDAPTIVDARGLTTFLTSTRKGYCQQFAFAMAVLARLLDIPSRVAYGFTSGTLQADGTWQVTTHDAHAWPELYFQGFGWLRFEPTPAGLAGQGTATSPTYTLQQSNVFQGLPPTVTGIQPSTVPGGALGLNAALAHQLNLPPGGFSGGGSVRPAAGLTGWDVFGLVMLGLAALIAVMAAAPACARLTIRRRRWRAGARGGDAGLAHAAWRELRDDLVDYRAGYSPSESPRALAARVSESLQLTGPAKGALRRVWISEERARYAARPETGTGLRDDSATIRRAIAAASPRRTRWFARLLPSSVVTPALIRFTAAADFTGRLNNDWLGGTRIGARLIRSAAPRRRSADESPAGRGEEALAAAGTRRD